MNINNEQGSNDPNEHQQVNANGDPIIPLHLRTPPPIPNRPPYFVQPSSNSIFRPKLQRFNGRDKGVTIENWLKLYENAAIMYRWTKNENIDLLGEYLECEALNYYLDSCDSNDWNEIKEKLNSRFGVRIVEPIASFVRMKYSQSKDFDDYFESKRRLANLAHLSEENAVALMIENLSEDMKRCFISNRPKTYHDFYITAKTAEHRVLLVLSMAKNSNVNKRISLKHVNKYFNILESQDQQVKCFPCFSCKSFTLINLSEYSKHLVSTSKLVDVTDKALLLFPLCSKQYIILVVVNIDSNLTTSYTIYDSMPTIKSKNQLRSKIFSAISQYFNDYQPLLKNSATFQLADVPFIGEIDSCVYLCQFSRCIIQKIKVDFDQTNVEILTKAIMGSLVSKTLLNFKDLVEPLQKTVEEVSSNLRVARSGGSDCSGLSETSPPSLSQDFIVPFSTRNKSHDFTDQSRIKLT